MTERGLPIVDGALACPFVAFDDDRDERAPGPDHRHRCYAEPSPAPRALAHQEAYCLSSAFPVCPTFQDWARREAARSRSEGPQPTGSDAAGIAGGRPERNPPRSWAAPPPWASRVGVAAGSGGPWDDDGEPGDEPRDAMPRQGRGLSGSYADRAAGGSAQAGGDFDEDPELGASSESMTSARPFERPMVPAERSPVTPPIVPAARPPVTPPPAAVRREPEPSWGDMDTTHDESQHDVSGEPSGQGVAVGGAVTGNPPRHRERDPSRDAAFAGNEERPTGAQERRAARRRDPGAPEWEAAPPPEAYPTLRARRLPELSLPPLLVAVLALALAAAVLFALPGLLGFGNPSVVATPTPGGSSRPSALASLPPTVAPEPTQQTYTVQAGDTMSRIADRFEVVLADLIAANQDNIPNPDQLQIGQVVIIPVPLPSGLPGASEVPAAP